MAEIREITLNHEPPNGGVPPNTTFAQATLPPNPDPAPADNGPPDGGAPPQSTPVNPAPPQCHLPPLCYPGPAYAVFPALLAMSLAHLPLPVSLQAHHFAGTVGTVGHIQPAGSSYNPLGQYLGEHAIVRFIWDGIRPCDFPCGFYRHALRYTTYTVPCSMTVRELIKQLGCPEGAQKGITEIIGVGVHQFVAGDTFTQGGEVSTRTLKEVGWTGERGVENEVLLAVKR